MPLTRKEFLDLSARGTMGTLVAASTFDLLGPGGAEARDAVASAEVQKVKDYIAAHKRARPPALPSGSTRARSGFPPEARRQS